MTATGAVTDTMRAPSALASPRARQYNASPRNSERKIFTNPYCEAFIAVKDQFRNVPSPTNRRLAQALFACGFFDEHMTEDVLELPDSRKDTEQKRTEKIHEKIVSILEMCPQRYELVIEEMKKEAFDKQFDDIVNMIRREVRNESGLRVDQQNMIHDVFFNQDLQRARICASDERDKYKCDIINISDNTPFSPFEELLGKKILLSGEPGSGKTRLVLRILSAFLAGSLRGMKFQSIVIIPAEKLNCLVGKSTRETLSDLMKEAGIKFPYDLRDKYTIEKILFIIDGVDDLRNFSAINCE